MIMLNEDIVKSFYNQYVNEDFFKTNILDNMLSAPVIIMIVGWCLKWIFWRNWKIKKIN